MTFATQHISVSINCSAEDAYQYISNPENMHFWAAGLSDTSLRKSGEYWIASSPMGTVKIRFADTNSYGVVDHDVTLPNGEVNHNPLRMIRNADGCEIIFTLFRLPRMSEEDFQNDAAMIEKDLLTLKAILEQQS